MLIRSRRPGLACAALCALASCHVELANPLAARWLEVRGEHVLLLSDAPEPRAIELVAECERLRSVLLSASQIYSAGNASLRTIRLIGFSDLKTLQDHFPIPNVGGLRIDDLAGESLLVVDAERDPADSVTVKHELAHALNAELMVREPRWLAEGLATYLETIRIDHEAGAMVIGEANPRMRGWLAGSPALDFERLLAGDHRDLYSSAPDAIRDFYAQSYLLTHTLVNGHRGRFGQFVRKLGHGDPPGAAFAAAFPDANPRKLEEEAEGSMRAFQVGRVPLPPPGKAPRVRRLAPVEEQALRAELAYYRARLQRDPGPYAAALAEARKSLAEDPHQVGAGEVAFRAARGAGEKLLIARDLVASNPGWGRGWLLLSWALRGRGAQAERLRALEKAVQLAPDSREALNSLAWDYLLEGRAAEALPLAARAVAAGRPQPNHLDTMALALDLNGRCAEAVQTQARAWESLPEGTGKRFAAELSSRLEAFRARCPRPQEAEPRRLACRDDLPPGAAVTGLLRVRANGRAEASQVVGEPRRVAEVEEWLAGCLFAPALRGGVPAEVEVKLMLAEEKAPAAEGSGPQRARLTPFAAVRR